MIEAPWIANVSEEAAKAWKPDAETVCISITEPMRFADLADGWADKPLRLKFHDIDPARIEARNAVAGRPRGTHQDAYTPCHPRQAEMIAAYATKHRGKNILVHCAAGISRSGAIVEALLQAFPEYEDRGWGRHPNGHVRSLMKRALGLVPAGIEVVNGF